MSKQDVDRVRKLARVTESLPDQAQAILLAYGEGIAAAAELYRPRAENQPTQAGGNALAAQAG